MDVKNRQNSLAARAEFGNIQKVHRIREQIFVVGFWMGMIISAQAADAQLPHEGENSKLVALAESWAGAVGGNQPEELTAILDEKYEHIHGTGLVENRSQFVEALRAGTRKYQPIHLEEVQVKAYEGFALVTGKFALRAEVRGKALEGVNRFCLTLIHRSEGWRILQFQATAINPRS